jgi:transcription elongation factor Elf1
VLFVGTGFYQVFFIQCPKCQSSVFWTAMKKLSFKRVPDQCGHCGLSFDQAFTAE